MSTLNARVHVTDEQGVNHVFTPEDDVPLWAQRLITNPKAWLEPPIDEAPEPAPVPAKKAAPAKRAPARRKAAADDAVRGG